MCPAEGGGPDFSRAATSIAVSIRFRALPRGNLEGSWDNGEGTGREWTLGWGEVFQSPQGTVGSSPPFQRRESKETTSTSLPQAGVRRGARILVVS